MTDVFTTPETLDVLSTLVGENKKFKDAEALAKGKQEADAFIESLKRENADLRGQLDPQFDAKTELEKLRQELAANRANPSGGTPKVDNPPLTVDGIAAIVNETITRAERDRTTQQNVQAANDLVVKAFGTSEAASNAVKAKAAELGLSTADLRAVAEKSPSAFEKIILGDAATGGSNTPLNPAVAPLLNPMTAVKPGSNEFFDAIFIKDRKRYFTPEVQMAIHKAVKDGTYQL